MTAFLLMTLSALAGSPLAGSPTETIDQTLEAFTQGAATRDVDRVSAALHPEARQFVYMPDGLQVIDRPSYLALLEAGKLGGTATTRTVDRIEVDGRRASARQVRDLGAFRLHDSISLVEVDGAWLIVSVSVEAEPVPSE